MKKERLWVFDFDGTVADTFTPSPSGVGVKEAYEEAIIRTLGETALQQYLDQGGLKNRSPREVVHALVGDVVSVGAVTELTERLVVEKIAYLEEAAFGQKLEDGSLWPCLMPGFVELWQTISVRRDVSTAILSSGHHGPISKTFLMNGLRLPDVFVTDDDLRRLPEPLSKPDPRLWEYLLTRLKQHDISFKRAVYVGDDQKKDGGLVTGMTNVEFILFAKNGRYCQQYRVISDFTQLLQSV